MSSALATAGAYKSGAASRITGVKSRTLDFWAHSKLLVPSIQDARGSGTDRLYSYADLRILMVLGQVDALSLDSRRKIVHAMREDGGAAFVRVRMSELLEVVINSKELHLRMTEALYGP